MWDGENRLAKMRSRSGSPAPERRIEFEYDWQGRRIRQTVWNDRDDGQGSELSDTLYLYDGWNLIAELNANSGNAKVRTYIWGLDLSGTMQGAGGIGGLLMVAYHVPATDTYHFAAYDGNGNIRALVNASDQNTSARYEYSPYGELQCSTGPLAALNPFRWSTKCWDEESGLVYYGHRYYHPSSGRWIGRDPIDEEGGLNIYAFILNDPLNAFDPLGMTKGGNQNKAPSGWENATPEEIQKEIDRLVKEGDPKKKAHIKQLRAWKKIRSSPSKYNNKFGRSSGRGGFATVAGVGVGAAASAILYAYAKLSTSIAVQEMRSAMNAGATFDDKNSPEGTLFDFVKHLDSGDTMWAELDAATFAAQGGGIAGWDALTDEIYEAE